MATTSTSGKRPFSELVTAAIADLYKGADGYKKKMWYTLRAVPKIGLGSVAPFFFFPIFLGVLYYHVTVVVGKNPLRELFTTDRIETVAQPSTTRSSTGPVHPGCTCDNFEVNGSAKVLVSRRIASGGDLGKFTMFSNGGSFTVEAYDGEVQQLNKNSYPWFTLSQLANPLKITGNGVASFCRKK